MDGAGFSAAYLFLDNAKKDNGIRTSILTNFFQELKKIGLNNIEYFLTDKDFSQINAAQSTWPDAKIQICLWHAKKALKKKLSDNEIKNFNHHSLLNSNQQYDFIDTQWILSFISRTTTSNHSIFCPKDLRSEVLNLFVKHYHQHPLIPSSQNEFLSSQLIQQNAVKEMYFLCYKHNLIHLWAYLWTNWYQDDKWILWARSASCEICIFKTTMLTESHWKVIKRDYLPKFFRPRLDLVAYIILTKLIPHNEAMFKKYIKGRQQPSWRKDFKHNWKELSKREPSQTTHYLTDSERWICSCSYFLTNRFFICKHLVNVVKENISYKFFQEVQRQGVYPLLGIGSSLKLNNNSLLEMDFSLNPNNIDNIAPETTTKPSNSSGIKIKKYFY